MSILLFAALALQGPGHSGLPTPKWPVALPAERHGHRVELLNGGLLSFGGFGDAKAKDREQRQTWWLAPGADKWVRRADMGRGRAFFGSARIGDAVFAIGESVESYDFARDKWSELVPAGQLPRSHFGAAAIGRELFVLGGYGGSEAALLVVDTDKRSVRSEPPPPEFAAGDHFHLVVALRGELHVVGGLDGEAFEPKREHWVRGKDGWRALPPPPAPLWAKFGAHGVIGEVGPLGESLYVFEEQSAWRYDSKTEKWTRTTPLGVQLVMPGVATDDRSLTLVGGMQVDEPKARVLMRFTPMNEAWQWLTPKSK